MKRILSTAALAAFALGIEPVPAQAETNPFIGTIAPMSFNFCPRSWLPADGRLLPIASYTALFSLFGTFYGGDGRTTFALPNLNGRSSIGDGTGPGLSTRTVGQSGGASGVTMTTGTMPTHTHSVSGNIQGNTVASNAAPSTTDPAGAYYSTFPDGTSIYADSSTPPVEMGIGSVVFESTANIANTGNSVAIANEQPYLAMYMCVAVDGVYPSRS